MKTYRFSLFAPIVLIILGIIVILTARFTGIWNNITTWSITAFGIGIGITAIGIGMLLSTISLQRTVKLSSESQNTFNQILTEIKSIRNEKKDTDGLSPQDTDTTTPQYHALLTEYHACQHDNSATANSYWIMSGIFIGISSALLVAFVYGLLSNTNILSDFTNTTTISASSQVWTIRLVVTAVGIGIITILFYLKLWAKRIRFLLDTNYDRMREIEADLGMWKSRIVNAIDNWGDLSEDEKVDLVRYKPLKWWKERAKNPAYEPPSRAKHYKWIFRTLITLWILTVCSIWLLPHLLIILSALSGE